MRRRILISTLKKIISDLLFWSDTLTADTLTDKSGEDNTCAITQSNCLYFDGTAKIEYQLDGILIHYVQSVEINYSTDNVNWQVADKNWQYFEVDTINNKIIIGDGFTGWISTTTIRSSLKTFIYSPLAEGVGSVTINGAEEYDNTRQFFADELVDNVIMEDNKTW